MRLLLALGVCAALASMARADAVLRISDGMTTKTITDNMVGDNNSLLGVVEYSGPIGTWIVQLTVGTTKPVMGTASAPHMDLFDLSISGGAGSITVEFTDDNFLAFGPAMGVHANIGGTTRGSVTAFVKGDDNNGHFGGSTVVNMGPFTPISFSGSVSGVLLGFSGTYSLTLGATITHTSSQTTSFDLDVTVPEPSSLAFLGSALGVIFLRRRRRS